ncbi:MAG: hypothetical protein HKN78_04515 [Sphingomonadaceae bacterium]|nr:hypothetical protein [Sphingomonadaceae bacterium]
MTILTQNAALIAALAGFAGAIIGGVLAAFGSVKAVRAAQKDIEADSLRRMRLECAINIAGLRHALTNSLTPSSNDKAKLMFELNRAPFLWYDKPEVISLLRQLRNQSGDTAENLAQLITQMSKDTPLDLSSLNESDIKQTAMVL